jgi:hypothetical protein
MALRAGALVFILPRGLREAVWLLVRVMMKGPVAVYMNVGVGSGNFSNVFKAIGSAVCECQGKRRQDATHEIKQRHKLRDTTSGQIGQNSKHENIMSSRASMRGKLEYPFPEPRMPALGPFGKGGVDVNWGGLTRRRGGIPGHWRVAAQVDRASAAGMGQTAATQENLTHETEPHADQRPLATRMPSV